jgi:hypothetical protein
MENKYTFIHPTKSGGTALEQYFQKYYRDYIIGTGHSNICRNNNNPIIVVRDVKSRFYSMYKYWKNGSIDGPYIRKKEWLTKYKNTSIFDFIEMLKQNKKELYSGFTWSQHFANTTSWIDPNINYKNLIIVKYKKDMNITIKDLLNSLNIKDKNIPLPFINVSNEKDCEYDLDDKDVNNFINEYFISDIELIYKINNNPELFKIVI